MQTNQPFFADYENQQAGLKRRQEQIDKVRDALSAPAGSAQFVNNNAGTFYAGTPGGGIGGALAKIVGAYLSNKQQGDLDAEKTASAAQTQGVMKDIAGRFAGTPEQRTPHDTNLFPGEAPIAGLQDVTPAQPATLEQKRQAVIDAQLSGIPQVQQFGAVQQKFLEADEARQEGYKQRNFEREQAVAARTQELEAQAAARLEQIRAQAAEGRITRQEADQRAAELRKDMIRLTASLRAPTPEQPLEAVLGPDGKPILVARKDAIGKTPASKSGAGSKNGGGKLPTAALKLQQEELDAIGTGSSINQDLAAVQEQLKTGKLNPSLVGNLEATVRDKLNRSTPESRNFLSFKATLEKLRNDSLRLNKGVQTEGDSQRAWQEILSNITDKAYVEQRLGEVLRLNERAVNLRKNNVDVIRGNYGLDSLDTSAYTNVPAALGPAATPGAPPAPTRRAGDNAPAPARIKFDAQGNQVP